jgi:hypothetical protein
MADPTLTVASHPDVPPGMRRRELRSINRAAFIFVDVRRARHARTSITRRHLCRRSPTPTGEPSTVARTVAVYAQRAELAHDQTGGLVPPAGKHDPNNPSLFACGRRDQKLHASNLR